MGSVFTVPILCYHSVSDTWDSALAMPEGRFERQCARLTSRLTPLDLTTAVDRLDRRGRVPRGTFVLTLDDGFADNYEVALPILRRYSIPAAVFVVAATIDRGHEVDWVDDPPDQPLSVLSADQILEMVEQGITVGSHSLFHRDLTTLGYQECVEDLKTSREVLEDLVRRPVPFLAYPRGRWNETVAAAAQAAGYQRAFSLPIGPEPIGPYSIPRVGIYRHNSERVFRLKLSEMFLSLRMAGFYERAKRLLAAS